MISCYHLLSVVVIYCRWCEMNFVWFEGWSRAMFTSSNWKCLENKSVYPRHLRIVCTHSIWLFYLHLSARVQRIFRQMHRPDCSGAPLGHKIGCFFFSPVITNVSLPVLFKRDWVYLQVQGPLCTFRHPIFTAFELINFFLSIIMVYLNNKTRTQVVSRPDVDQWISDTFIYSESTLKLAWWETWTCKVKLTERERRLFYVDGEELIPPTTARTQTFGPQSEDDVPFLIYTISWSHP